IRPTRSRAAVTGGQHGAERSGGRRRAACPRGVCSACAKTRQGHGPSNGSEFSISKSTPCSQQGARLGCSRRMRRARAWTAWSGVVVGACWLAAACGSRNGLDTCAFGVCAGSGGAPRADGGEAGAAGDGGAPAEGGAKAAGGATGGRGGGASQGGVAGKAGTSGDAGDGGGGAAAAAGAAGDGGLGGDAGAGGNAGAAGDAGA